jgi:polyhydroxyalkanoate synthesis regulator phasin
LEALPVLGAARNQQSRLQQILLHQYYLAAADLVELYGKRNVFSLEMIQPPSRQKMIRELYEQYIVNSDNATTWNDSLMNDWMNMNSTDNGVKKNETESVNTITVNIDDIPTTKDIQSVEEEIHTLRLQLQQLKERRQSLSNDISVLKSLNENHNAAIPKAVQDIPKTVQATIRISNALRECQNDSSTLQQRMESMQLEREGTMDAIVHPPTTQRSMTVRRDVSLSLQERYDQDHQQYGSISARSLASLTEALKKE